MPTTSTEEDDPVIASYDVYIARGEKFAPSTDLDASKSRIFLLQYPSHRPLSRPYNAAASQKPTALRLKQETGVLEVDIPFLTDEHYNAENGSTYHKALTHSRIASEGGTHGLAGGFNAVAGGHSHSLDLRDIPAHNEADDSDHDLETQTLGGKIVAPTSGDPVYMLGSFHNNEIHLSHLDALVQVRPQLHHIDAQEELSQRRTAASLAKTKPTAHLSGPPKIESKAIDIKLKDKNDDGKDRSLNANSRLLHNIQKEPWQVYDWVDEEDSASNHQFRETMHMRLPTPIHPELEGEPEPVARLPPQLRSSIRNSEWLDKMSAPRETGHGKKGLLAKLRGREREKARRKKTEEDRKRRAADAQDAIPGGGGAASTTLLTMGSSSSSDLSSLSDDDAGSDTAI